jgi:hypothetical protein
MRKPKSKRDRQIVEADWEKCICLRYLLELEVEPAKLNPHVTDPHSDIPAMLLRSTTSTSVLKFFIKAWQQNESLSRLVVDTAFDLKLPSLDYQYDPDDQLCGPFAGEVAARAFIKCAFLAYSDLLEANIESRWHFIEHGLSIATAWANWQQWAQHSIDGGSRYQAMQRGELVGSASSIGGKEKNMLLREYGIGNREATKHRDELIRAEAETMNASLSIRRKAELIESKSPGFGLKSEAIRKILKSDFG